MTESRTQPIPARSPVRFGCYLGLVSALVLGGFGLRMLFGSSDQPLPFQIAVLLAGALQGVLSVQALRGQRAAWAFALSLNGTMAVMFLFGAPKVRDAFDVAFALGLAPAVGFGLITGLLAMGGDEYGR